MFDHDYHTTTIEDAAEFAHQNAEPDYAEPDYADEAGPFGFRRKIDPVLAAKLDDMFKIPPCPRCADTGCTDCIPF